MIAVTSLLLLNRNRTAPVAAQCGPNPIVCENGLTGNPTSEWDIVGSGDSTIQGFATDISANKGDTVHFKVTTTAAHFNIDVYRLGYYGGFGARKIASLTNITGKNQSACLLDASTLLVDCGNWTESTTWVVPTTAVSGIYVAKLTRIDTGGASHVVFVVRDDASTSELLFQTSDTTWQAYNQYGGNSLYRGTPQRAYKVSYNRPFATRGQSGGFGPSDWVFYAEYPTVRWLEANGYNVTYTTGMDTDRRGTLIKNHKAFLSVGHDEYWSGQQRTNVEAARAAGVHLAFLSGNETFWKTRWEGSIDGSATAYRTLVSYKETNANARLDPLDPPTWTGTWRDPRFSPPADGGRPENALSGQVSTVDRGSAAITVPSTYSALRFWRNTSVATLGAGETATLAAQTVGYEWDEDLDNGFRPAGLMRLSSTVSNVTHLVDFGTTYVPDSATHALTLYRHSSGALVFGAGSVQYVWGLDPNHDVGPDTGSATADANIKQATVNLLADMGVQPGSLQTGTSPATASLDVTPPTSTISSPTAGATLPAGTWVTIAGMASDAGGVVAGVEVSVDDGTTWHRAVGLQSWTYSWRPGVLGTTAIRSRAVDDSGNVTSPTSSTSVTIAQANCPCTIWDDPNVPKFVDVPDPYAQELGVQFQSDIAGVVTGIRFYKAATNLGTHVGNLWSSSGTLMATATFTSESASGWQQVTFGTPVSIAANTTYVASYHTNVGHYSADSYYFGTSGVDQWPLHALSNAAGNGNGVFAGGATSTFPNSSYFATSYWVDVVFSRGAPDTTPPTITATTPASGATGVSTTTTVTAAFSEAMDISTINASTFVLRDSSNTIVPATATYNTSTDVATLTPGPALAGSATYTATVVGGSGGVKDLAGNALAANRVWSFTTGAGPTCPCTIWSASTVPANISANDPNAQELGVKFRSSTNGTITGIRFYKGATNTGTHVGNLWTSGGTLLATATFTGETASGWQQVTFAAPVSITANTTYVASYHTNTGNPSYNSTYFTSAVDNGPLHAFSTGESGGNGVYVYGASAFPQQTWNANNYWVDVVFDLGAPDTTPPTVTSVTPANGATGVNTGTTVTATFSEAMNAATITSSTFVLRDPSNTVISSAVTYNASTNVAALAPAQALAASTTYTATITGGASGVNDLAGNALAVNRVWSFTTGTGPSCPCTIWSASTVPANQSNDPNAQELGVKFQPDANGTITGIRFYKGATNTGTHVGNLWTSGGTLLATATFSGETASGWQQVNFATAVNVTANTTYVASYHTNAGNPAYNSAYFASAGVDNTPLHALASGVSGGNGVFIYGATAFPTQTYNTNNYWVDVVFATGTPDTTPPTVVSVTPANNATAVATTVAITATFSEAMNAATITTGTGGTFVLRDPGNAVVAATVSYNPATNVATLTPSQALAASTIYTATISSGASGVKDLAGNALASNYVWSFTTGNGALSIWSPSAVPANTATGDSSAIELGLRFRSDVNGRITGVRFYKAATNTGTHVANLWTNTGTLLATATFTGETGSGWQQVTFATPVTITANTTYVVSYHVNNGNFSFDRPYFAGAGVDSPPLHALADGVSGSNGVFIYSANSAFPTQSYNSSNYWVDVVFTTP